MLSEGSLQRVNSTGFHLQVVWKTVTVLESRVEQQFPECGVRKQTRILSRALSCNTVPVNPRERTVLLKRSRVDHTFLPAYNYFYIEHWQLISMARPETVGLFHPGGAGGAVPGAQLSPSEREGELPTPWVLSLESAGAKVVAQASPGRREASH